MGIGQIIAIVVIILCVVFAAIGTGPGLLTIGLIGALAVARLT